MAKFTLFLALSAILAGPAFAQTKCKSANDCPYPGGQAQVYCNTRVGLCGAKTAYLDSACTYDEDCDATAGTKGPPPDYKGPMVCTAGKCAKKASAAAAAPCAAAKAGYTLKADTNWDKLAGSTGGQTTPAEAEKMCNSNPSCLAWNSFGYYIIASSGAATLKYSPYTGLCVYVKDPAPPKSASACAPAKAGFTLRADTNWGKLAGAKESQTTPAEAEKICNATPSCLAWNSFGYYIIASSGSLSFSPYTGLCIYVKNPTKIAAAGRHHRLLLKA